VKSSSWRRIPTTTQFAAGAPDVAKAVAKWEKKVAEMVDVPIAEAKRAFAGADLKALIERATTESLGVDFSYMNRGGVRAPLPAGKLLARHVWNAYPFDNKVVVGRFKGKDLPKVVTEGRQIDPEREYTLAVNDFTAANQHAASQLASTGLVFSSDGPLQRDLLIDWIKKQKVLQ
jgi:2',3'-cyclic-nucleotide 2'-phosphodiesterase (5'-nucleotidase family)